METFIASTDWIIFAFCALQAIVFLQSGLDKAFNFSGNLDWLKGHFAQSALSGAVPVLLFVLMLLEIASGAFSLIGLFWAFEIGDLIFVQWAIVLSFLAYLALFFGQRMAKDYPGAATIVPYFIVSLLGAFYVFGISAL